MFDSRYPELEFHHRESTIIEDQTTSDLSSSDLLDLLNRGANAIYVTDTETGRFVYVNDRACETTGYSRDELIGAHISRVEVNFTHKIGWQDFVNEVRQHPRFTIQGEHQRKDGTRFPVEVDVDLLQQDDREYILSVIRPLDEQNSRAQEIIEAYSHYFTLFKHSPIALWNFDLSSVFRSLSLGDTPSGSISEEDLPDDDRIQQALYSEGEIIDVNVSTLELLKAQEKEEIIRNIDTILAPELQTTLVDVFKNILAGTYQQEIEISPNTTDGERRTLIANYMVPPNSRDNLSNVFVSMLDITPRRNAQQRAEKRRRELEKSEKNFRQMAENIDEVFYNLGPNYSDISYVSPAYEDIWERNRDELYDDPWRFSDAIHEEDRERIIEEKQAFIDNISSDSKLLEYRIITPDGKIKWIQEEMFAVRVDGELKRIVGYAKEITERKRAQQELQKSLEEKKALLGEIHHRVKNNMQIVASLLKMQLRKLDSDSDRRAFEDSIERVKAMALIHEKLYQTERLADFNLESYLRSLGEHLLDFHDTDVPKENLTVDIDSVDLDPDKAIACGLIVSELVNNSLEHGLDGTDQERIKIRLNTDGNGTCRLAVSDNGQGISSTDLEDPTTAGFDILKALVDYELEGTFSIESSEGVKAEVRFDV